MIEPKWRQDSKAKLADTSFLFAHLKWCFQDRFSSFRMIIRVIKIIVIKITVKIIESNLCFKAADNPIVALFHPHVHVVVGVDLLLCNALQ